jgi:hypothetical protein
MDPVITEQLGPRRPTPAGREPAPGNGDSASNDRLGGPAWPGRPDHPADGLRLGLLLSRRHYPASRWRTAHSSLGLEGL